MSRKYDIIHELELEHEVELDPNSDAGVNGLCNDDACPRSECSCWSRFETAINAELVETNLSIRGLNERQ